MFIKNGKKKNLNMLILVHLKRVSQFQSVLNPSNSTIHFDKDLIFSDFSSLFPTMLTPRHPKGTSLGQELKAALLLCAFSL